MRKLKIKKNGGMSYVELIVVLTIFSVLSSVVVFNYGDFQAKVDIKNLASDIALKIVEAQKESLSGKLPAKSFSPAWKPSYGIYFSETIAVDSKGADNKNFFYFTDLDTPLPSNGAFDGSDCSLECLNKITITKGNYISDIKVYGSTNSSPNNLAVTFTRPISSAVMASNDAIILNVSYAEITIVSPKGASAKIKVYSSGRIEIN